MVFIAGKLCDPCLRALKWFVGYTIQGFISGMCGCMIVYLQAAAVTICDNLFKIHERARTHTHS